MIRYFRNDQSLRRALIWLVVFAAIGAALVLLYHDADQQDSGYHFLFARWARRHPRYLVGVWARPLFTLLYSLPAQFGYAAAKFFTVIISLAAAWQTFRLARQIKLDRAELAIPLLFLQPSFFLLSSTVLTETLFALVFVIAQGSLLVCCGGCGFYLICETKRELSPQRRRSTRGNAAPLR